MQASTWLLYGLQIAKLIVIKDHIREARVLELVSWKGLVLDLSFGQKSSCNRAHPLMQSPFGMHELSQAIIHPLSPYMNPTLQTSLCVLQKRLSGTESKYCIIQKQQATSAASHQSVRKGKSAVQHYFKRGSSEARELVQREGLPAPSPVGNIHFEGRRQHLLHSTH